MSTFYVDGATGNDADDGLTLATAKLTISAGVALAFAGDTVSIRGGTYTGIINSVNSGATTVRGGTSYANAITIAAYPAETVIIAVGTGGGNAITLTSATQQYLIFDRLILDGIGMAAFAGGLYQGPGSHHVRFQNGEIKNSPGQGVNTSPTAAGFLEILDSPVHDNGGNTTPHTHNIYFTNSDNLVDGCDIYNGGACGVVIYDAVAEPSRNVIQHCRIHDNAFYSESDVSISGGAGNIFKNNWVYGAAGSGLFVGFASPSGTEVCHNTFVHDGGIYIHTDASGTLVMNNIVRNAANSGAGPITDNGSATVQVTNLTAAPSLVDAANFDFHLLTGSAAKDAGTLLVSVTDDFDGGARPVGPAPDIGACEFGSAPAEEDEAPPADADASEPAPFLGMKPFAEVDLNDPITYYGGYKAPWVLNWHRISRSCSDRAGQIEHMAFGCRMSDTHRYFRGRLGVESTRYLTNKPLVERMIDDEERRRLGLPRVVANGYVSDYSPEPNLQFVITGTDWLKKKFSRKRKAQQSWQPLIMADDFPAAAEEILNTACPIVLGHMSDTDVVTTAIGTTLPFDSTIPAVSSLIAHDVQGSGTLNGWIAVIVTVVIGGNEGPPSNVAGTYDFNRAVKAFWNSVPGADSYRIYFYDAPWGHWLPHSGVSSTPPPPTFVRMLTHNVTPGDGDWNGIDLREFGVLFTADTDGANALTGVTTSSVDQGHGLVNPIYLGIEAIGSPPELHHAGLVSRCAMQQIPALYLDGVSQNIDTDDTWKVPGHAPWSALFADPFEDINGRRYTKIYGKVGYPGPDRMAGVLEDPTVPTGGSDTLLMGVTLSVLGVETDGDGGGTLITRGLQQALWFANNFIAPDTPYQAGAYLTAADTTFPHLVGLTLVDEVSLEETDVATEDRIGGSPGIGYEGAGIIGANGEFLSALDALARFAVSYDFDWIWTRKGQLGASLEPIVPVVGVTAIDDVISIVDQSFRITDQVSTDFFNIHPFTHTRDYAGHTDTGWWVKDEVRDTASITNYDQEREAPLWELHFGRRETAAGLATVADVMQRKRARFRHPRRWATLRVPLSGVTRQLGEAVPITHIEGIGASGWIDHQVRIVSDELDPNDNTIVFAVYDLETVYEV